MTRILLLKYGEMVLKGLNRGYFNMLLERRVKQLLAPITQPGGSFSIEYMQSTMYVRAHGNADIALALERLKKVFGVAAICPSFETEKNIESICSTAAECMNELIGNAKTFKCTARRSDKSFPLTSPEICDYVGGALLDARPSLKVDVHDPEVTVTVEIRDKAAYIHGAPVKGAGGMPNGSNGRAMLLLSGGIDSPVAGYLAAKRGVAIDCVYFESPPYTSEMAREKVISLARRLYLYTSNIYLHCVPSTRVQELIRDNCEEKLTTLLLRRFMVRTACAIAHSVGSQALITGESVGQVASQTLLSLAATNDVSDMLILRPCIAMDKEDIVTVARQIGTYDISVLPYEDCCTVFTPKHPNTRPEIPELEKEEEKLDLKALIKEAFESQTVIKISSEN